MCTHYTGEETLTPRPSQLRLWRELVHRVRPLTSPRRRRPSAECADTAPVEIKNLYWNWRDLITSPKLEEANEIAAAAETHLDFESSIQKEIQAEMYLQKDLNLMK